MVLFFGILLVGVLAFQKTVGEPQVVASDDPWTRYDNLFKFYAMQNSVNWMWLKAIALNESDLGRDPRVALGIKNPNDIEGSKSSDGKSWGLMQMTLPTARDMEEDVTIADLNNPTVSIRLAAEYVSRLKMSYPNWDDRKIIMSYNQGPGNTLKGQSYAQGYWEKFVTNLQRVKDGL